VGTTQAQIAEPQVSEIRVRHCKDAFVPFQRLCDDLSSPTGHLIRITQTCLDAIKIVLDEQTRPQRRLNKWKTLSSSAEGSTPLKQSACSHFQRTRNAQYLIQNALPRQHLLYLITSSQIQSRYSSLETHDQSQWLEFSVLNPPLFLLPPVTVLLGYFLLSPR
jgi:hypothetical protein